MAELGGNNPPPPAAPAGLFDPFVGLQKLNVPPLKLLAEAGNVYIGLAQVGYDYRDIGTGNASSDLALSYLEKVARRGEWVWYSLTPTGTLHRLVYLDAVTGQSAMVCSPLGSQFVAAPCPPVGTPQAPQRRVNR
jgi:hypothetical protein